MSLVRSHIIDKRLKFTYIIFPIRKSKNMSMWLENHYLKDCQVLYLFMMRNLIKAGLSRLSCPLGKKKISITHLMLNVKNFLLKILNIKIETCRPKLKICVLKLQRTHKNKHKISTKYLLQNNLSYQWGKKNHRMPSHLLS